MNLQNEPITLQLRTKLIRTLDDSDFKAIFTLSASPQNDLSDVLKYFTKLLYN